MQQQPLKQYVVVVVVVPVDVLISGDEYIYRNIVRRDKDIEEYGHRDK